MPRIMAAGTLIPVNWGNEVSTGFFMDNSIQKSCWGVTAWAVAGVACVIVLALLFGDVESASILAAN